MALWYRDVFEGSDFSFFQAKSKKDDLRLTASPAAAPVGFPASYIEDQRARAACKRGTVVLRYPSPLNAVIAAVRGGHVDRQERHGGFRHSGYSDRARVDCKKQNQPRRFS